MKDIHAPIVDPEKVANLKTEILNNLIRKQAHGPETATAHDWWTAVCLTTWDRILENACTMRGIHRKRNVKRVYYFSLEYLMGKLLENNLVSIGALHETRAALKELGQDLDILIAEGPDLGLGNGGLGRLAACFMDSLSTLDLPAIGYGINLNSACSASHLLMANKWNFPTNGAASARPGAFAAPSMRSMCPFTEGWN